MYRPGDDYGPPPSHICNRCEGVMYSDHELKRKRCVNCQSHCEICDGPLTEERELSRGTCNQCCLTDCDLYE